MSSGSRSARLRPERPEVVRWLLAALAVCAAVVFVAVQGRSSDARYELNTASSRLTPTETPTATLPSSAELTNQLRRQSRVRLPGATAWFDEAQVRAAIGDADIRIVVAPIGLTSDQSRMLYELDPFDEDATGVHEVIRIEGTAVSGGGHSSLADDLPGWQRQFAQGDITGPLLALVAALRDAPTPADPKAAAVRAPTAAELAPVLAAVRSSGVHLDPAAGVTEVPATAGTAFPDAQPIIATFPRSTPGAPLVDWATALSAAFPGRPVVTLTGLWVDYRGPDADRFAEIASASYYGQYRTVLSERVLPTQGVLRTFLARIAELRLSGIFGRALPAPSFDPLSVTLPALPIVFAGCAAGFLVLSVRQLRRRPLFLISPAGRARLAGLSSLLIETSGLADRRADAPLARAAVALRAAGSAMTERGLQAEVRRQLDAASAELKTVADLLGRKDYRPTEYVRVWAR
ncbi:MAG: hypothetical protein WKF57_14135 [Nakamurella sp.]